MSKRGRSGNVKTKPGVTKHRYNNKEEQIISEFKFKEWFCERKHFIDIHLAYEPHSMDSLWSSIVYTSWLWLFPVKPRCSLFYHLPIYPAADSNHLYKPNLLSYCILGYSFGL